MSISHPSKTLLSNVFQSSVDQDCSCRKCIREKDEVAKKDYETNPTQGGLGIFMPAEMSRMILCSICGNKRCPHASSHLLTCTNSNEPGQPGSDY